MEYTTLKKREQGEICEKKSRFICTLQPVTTVEDAALFVDEIKGRYFDARHNVYAYILSTDNIKRYSDDAEPSGTAGIPVLSVLEGEDLKNVAAVVTRYFGGVLLGTGGLARAYKAAVKEALRNSEKVLYCLCDTVRFSAEYSMWGKLENYLKFNNISYEAPDFRDKVYITLYSRKENTDKLIKNIVELSGAKVVPTAGECGYVFLDNWKK